jgi:hypothetical protein
MLDAWGAQNRNLASLVWAGVFAGLALGLNIQPGCCSSLEQRSCYGSVEKPLEGGFRRPPAVRRSCLPGFPTLVDQECCSGGDPFYPFFSIWSDERFPVKLLLDPHLVRMAGSHLSALASHDPGCRVQWDTAPRLGR